MKCENINKQVWSAFQCLKIKKKTRCTQVFNRATKILIGLKQNKHSPWTIIIFSSFCLFVVYTGRWMAINVEYLRQNAGLVVRDKV